MPAVNLEKDRGREGGRDNNNLVSSSIPRVEI
jgi:hypothetical protein